MKGPHRLLNWQIQVTRVSWVGQSTIDDDNDDDGDDVDGESNDDVDDDDNDDYDLATCAAIHNGLAPSLLWVSSGRPGCSSK